MGSPLLLFIMLASLTRASATTCLDDFCSAIPDTCAGGVIQDEEQRTKPHECKSCHEGHELTAEKFCEPCAYGKFRAGTGTEPCADWLTCPLYQKRQPGSKYVDATCVNYEGTCANGDIKALVERRKDNHCGSCDAGFKLNPAGATSCDPCGEGRFSLDGTSATSCTPWTQCTTYQKQTTAPLATRDRVCTNYEGTCANGVLATLQYRTNDNHCGECNDGFWLDRSVSPLPVCKPLTACPHPNYIAVLAPRGTYFDKSNIRIGDLQCATKVNAAVAPTVSVSSLAQEFNNGASMSSLEASENYRSKQAICDCEYLFAQSVSGVQKCFSTSTEALAALEMAADYFQRAGCATKCAEQIPDLVRKTQACSGSSNIMELSVFSSDETPRDMGTLSSTQRQIRRKAAYRTLPFLSGNDYAQVQLVPASGAVELTDATMTFSSDALTAISAADMDATLQAPTVRLARIGTANERVFAVEMNFKEFATPQTLRYKAKAGANVCVKAADMFADLSRASDVIGEPDEDGFCSYTGKTWSAFGSMTSLKTQPVCFTCDTPIMLANGTFVQIGELSPGDELEGNDIYGEKERVYVRQMIRRPLAEAEQHHLVTIRAGACGADMPFSDVTLTKQHAIRCPKMMEEDDSVDAEVYVNLHTFPERLPRAALNYGATASEVCNIDVGDAEQPLNANGLKTESWDGKLAHEPRDYIWQPFMHTPFVQRYAIELRDILSGEEVIVN